MNKFRISTKLFALVGFLLLLALGLGGFGVWGIARVNAGLETVYNDRVVCLGQLGIVRNEYLSQVVQIAIKVRQEKLTPPEGSQALDSSMKEAHGQWKDYSVTYLTEDEKKLVAEAEPRLQAADAAIARLRASFAADDKKRITESIAADVIPTLDPLAQTLESLISLQLRESKREFGISQELYKTMRMGAIFALLLGFGIALLFAAAIIRNVTRLTKEATNITQQVNQAIGQLDTTENKGSSGGTGDEIAQLVRLMKAMLHNLEFAAATVNRVAAGDLTTRITLASSDQSSSLYSIAEMNAKLSSLIEGVRLSASNLASGSEQISAGAQQLSQGSAEQASSTEEISAAVTQLGAQAKESAMNVVRAKGTSEQTMESATQGSAMMKDMLESMAEIGRASSNISKIIKTIDEIAFQTNLLALNAAVEAARAGKYGRGFAVVAEEVNNLSKRSQQAARETAEIIEDSIRKVARGESILTGTEQVFRTIFDGVKGIATLTDQVNRATAEQVSGIEQIETGIRQIETATQQGASISQENAATSEELSGQAGHLSELVAVFKVQGTGLPDKSTAHHLPANKGTQKTTGINTGSKAPGRDVDAATIIDLGDRENEFAKF